ncbi:MAG: hypothetical protein ACRD07_04580 [Acidimicrobiales bacterium]
MLATVRPTVWTIDSGILEPIAGATPVRINVLSLADVKRALDLIRRHKDDRQLLVQVMRVLRDRAALAGAEEGLADLAAGRVVPLRDDLLDELRATERGKQRSGSS